MRPAARLPEEHPDKWVLAHQGSDAREQLTTLAGGEYRPSRQAAPIRRAADNSPARGTRRQTSRWSMRMWPSTGSARFRLLTSVLAASVAKSEASPHRPDNSCPIRPVGHTRGRRALARRDTFVFEKWPGWALLPRTAWPHGYDSSGRTRSVPMRCMPAPSSGASSATPASPAVGPRACRGHRRCHQRGHHRCDRDLSVGLGFFNEYRAERPWPRCAARSATTHT